MLAAAEQPSQLATPTVFSKALIERMDEYYLSREDWDTIVELGVDEQKDDVVMKKISTATKTALTKKYVWVFWGHSDSN